MTAWDSRGNGSVNIGLEGNYLSVWQFALTYTHFIGDAVPFVDYSPLLAGGAADLWPRQYACGPQQHRAVAAPHVLILEETHHEPIQFR